MSIRLISYFRAAENSGSAFPFTSACYHSLGDQAIFWEYIRESWYFWMDGLKWEFYFHNSLGQAEMQF